MSDKIRKLLTPVQKRIYDCVSEVPTALDNYSIRELEVLQNKIISNLKYHEELFDRLGDIVDEDVEKQTLGDAMVEKCVTLNIDAKEAITLIDARVGEEGCVEFELSYEIMLDNRADM